MSEKHSPVIQLLQTIWDNTNAVTGSSWTRLNGAMFAGMKLAITSAFKFEEDDFLNAYKMFRGWYWFHGAEAFYCFAVECDRTHNRSACIALEKYFNRPAYIWKGKRLCVGSEIKMDYRWYVTSFGDGVINFSRYNSDENPHGMQQGNPTGRLKLTHKEFKTLAKETK